MGKTAVDNDYSDSVMICLRPAEEIVKTFVDLDACTEDADDLHITLLYLGSTEEAGGEQGRERLTRACYDMGLNSGYRGLSGKVNGWGNFINPDASVLIALWDIPGIAEFRTHLQNYCRAHAAKLRRDDHGFTPHMTIAYHDEPVKTLPQMPETEESHFTSIWLVWGEDWQEIGLA